MTAISYSARGQWVEIQGRPPERWRVGVGQKGHDTLVNQTALLSSKEVLVTQHVGVNRGREQ